MWWRRDERSWNSRLFEFKRFWRHIKVFRWMRVDLASGSLVEFERIIPGKTAWFTWNLQAWKWNFCQSRSSANWQRQLSSNNLWTRSLAKACGIKLLYVVAICIKCFRIWIGNYQSFLIVESDWTTVMWQWRAEAMFDVLLEFFCNSKESSKSTTWSGREVLMKTYSIWVAFRNTEFRV